MKEEVVNRAIRDFCWLVVMSICTWGVFCYLIPWMNGMDAEGVGTAVKGVSIVLLYLSGVMIAISAFLSLILVFAGLVEVCIERKAG